MEPLDTSTNAQKRQAELFAAMSGSERVEMAMEMFDFAKDITCDGIRARNPEYDEEQVFQEFFRVLHGDEIAQKVFASRQSTIRFTRP